MQRTKGSQWRLPHESAGEQPRVGALSFIYSSARPEMGSRGGAGHLDSERDLPDISEWTFLVLCPQIQVRDLHRRQMEQSTMVMGSSSGRYKSASRPPFTLHSVHTLSRSPASPHSFKHTLFNDSHPRPRPCGASPPILNDVFR